jgi:hypothetical protein
MVGRSSRWNVRIYRTDELFSRQVLSFKSRPRTDSDAVPDRPGILYKEGMVEAGSLALGAKIISGNVPELTLALSVQCNVWSAIRRPDWACGAVAGYAWLKASPHIGCRFIPALEDIVR